MTATVQKWGNSLAIRIPRSVARDVSLKDGSLVNLAVQDGKVVIEPSATPEYSLDDLLKGVSKRNLHRGVETGPAVGREAW
jgi:antitoxin MazE